MSNERYEKTVRKYKISIITPVHIGNGNKLSQVDFVLDKGMLRVIDIDEVISKIQNNQKALAIFNLQDNPEALINEFEQGRFNMKEFLDAYKISYSSVEKYSCRCSYSNPREISEFMKTGLGRPYIPGSSIKGALRTVILWHLIKDSKPKEVTDRLEQILNPDVGEKQDNNLLNKHLFGKNPNYDFLRGLQVGDAGFEIKDIAAGETKVLNIDENRQYGWKKLGKYGFTTHNHKEATSIFTEMLNKEATSEVAIKIESFLFDYPLAKKQLGFNDKKKYLTQLAKKCNEYAKEFIKNELDFYHSYKMNPLEKFYEQLQVPDDNDGFLLHLGWGSGWRGMTGNWLDDKYLRRFREKFSMRKSFGEWQQFPIFPKTRKIIFENNQPYPLGWVKMEEVKNG